MIASLQQRDIDSGLGEIAREEQTGRAGPDHQNVGVRGPRRSGEALGDLSAVSMLPSVGPAQGRRTARWR
ncbi:hypothetical protein EDD90_6221 [Streptomyces sp. Ag109_O5-1]|nr:hypothetical protein EDD90_6221 [Streptomyces sp. Ag109_O5-1]